MQIENRSILARTENPVKTETKSDGKGRDDMTVMFNFLRRKGVKRIIHVIVADQDGVPHSDAAIEKALSKFQVEIWDWQRFDLCTETIACVAPAVEQAHLYWSGNSAVLWGWSEKDILDRMQNLKKVNLHVNRVCQRLVQNCH